MLSEKVSKKVSERESEEIFERESEELSKNAFGVSSERGFQKILVALDLTDTNGVVFKKALALATATQSSLMLLHVLSGDQDGGPSLPVSASWEYYAVMSDQTWKLYQTQWQDYEKQGLETLQGYAQQAQNAGVTVEFTQMGTQPGSAICALAKTWEADTIVVGSHGRKGLSELFLGSVSNYVMHHAPCSVLVVHLNQKQVTSKNRLAMKPLNAEISVSELVKMS